MIGRKGDKVILVKKLDHAPKLKLESHGVIVAVRHGTNLRLVKFIGYGNAVQVSLEDIKEEV